MTPKSENRTKDYLKKLGYYFIRAGRSYGIWDFIASNDKEILFIQAKCTQGPRSEELARIKDFNHYPKRTFIKKQVWIWQKYKREPMVKNID
jgi:hypothetical protein